MENCCKKKHREDGESRALINRLSRIEGQVRGVKNMLENDAYCTDIILQVSAISSALKSFQGELLSRHIETCVKDGIKNGDDEIINELIETLKKMR